MKDNLDIMVFAVEGLPIGIMINDHFMKTTADTQTIINRTTHLINERGIKISLSEIRKPGKAEARDVS
jgi:hypothetical protein